MATLEDYYVTLLASVGVVPDNEGLLNIVTPAGTVQCLCEGKRLVLPTHEVLRNPDWDSTIAFHPLSENTIVGGESPVLKKLRKLIKSTVNTKASFLMIELMRLAVEKDNHSKLTHKQTDLLATLPTAVKQTYDAVIRFTETVTINPDRSLTSTYLKLGGTYKGAKMRVVAVTSFPPLEDFASNSKTIFGEEFTKRDKKLIEDLFLYIFEDCAEKDEYSYGSNDMTAPYLHALLNSYLLLANRLNKVVRKFKNVLEDPDELIIDTSWESMLTDFHTLRDKIPPLAGNEGSIEREKIHAERGVSPNRNALYQSIIEDGAEPSRPVTPRREELPEEMTRIQNLPTRVEEKKPASPFRSMEEVEERQYPNRPSAFQAPYQAPPPPPPREYYQDHRRSGYDRRDHYDDRRRHPQDQYDPYYGEPEIVETENGISWQSVVATNPAIQQNLREMRYHNPHLGQVQQNYNQFNQPVTGYGRGYQTTPDPRRFSTGRPSTPYNNGYGRRRGGY